MTSSCNPSVIYVFPANGQRRGKHSMSWRYHEYRVVLILSAFLWAHSDKGVVWNADNILCSGPGECFGGSFYERFMRTWLKYSKTFVMHWFQCYSQIAYLYVSAQWSSNSTTGRSLSTEKISYPWILHIPWICHERKFNEFYLFIWTQLVFNQRLQLFVQSPQPYLLIFAWKS